MIQIENRELSENQSEIKISSKPPYLLGFLGFIPLVGFCWNCSCTLRID